MREVGCRGAPMLWRLRLRRRASDPDRFPERIAERGVRQEWRTTRIYRTRLASARCSVRALARDVNSEPGRSVDVRDKTDDTVSRMRDRLASAFDSCIRAPHSPATPYDSGFPLPPFPLESSFCARSRLRVISLRMSKWRTRNSCPSNAFDTLSLSAALSNEA